MKKLFILLMVLFPVTAFADVTSYDNTFAANCAYSSDFCSQLNANFTKSLTGGINNITAANIKDASLTEADMADEINPRKRTYEGASCEFVYSGLLPVATSGLQADTSAGTAYPRGYRINKSSATSHSYTASKWTYVDLDQNGNFNYSEVSIGAAVPSVAANSIRLARVSTDGSVVNTVTDLRKTSCTQGPFSTISDASGEATLGDIFKNASSGLINGLRINTRDTTSVTIGAGTAYINGYYRTTTTDQTATLNQTGNSLTGISGLDTGSMTAGTRYYIYAAADEPGVSRFTPIFSTSLTPSGVTNYRRIGEVSTDASNVLTTTDPVTVSGVGKIIQVKKYQTGAVATGTTVVPFDDTPPLVTEGTTFITVPFTPTNAKNTIKAEIQLQMNTSASGAQSLIGCIFADGANRGCGYTTATTSENGRLVKFNSEFLAGQTTSITFKVNGGSDQAGTVTLNGSGGSRKYGGYLVSSLTLTEYEA